jgi:polyhydroxybutyrate depolymerase
MTQRMTWDIEGVQREAQVYFPSKITITKSPIMFAFHGHKGTAAGYARKSFETYWPKAIVVYPQGLPTVSPGDSSGVDSGWQHSIGEVSKWTGVKDQDLKFFNVMVSNFIEALHADSDCVTVHGWSNGGLFAYNVLWPKCNLLALACASATVKNLDNRLPISVMQIAGKLDPVVHYNSQVNTVTEIKGFNKCYPTAKRIIDETDLTLDRFASELHLPIEFCSYNGQHEYPDEVIPLIPSFLKGIVWNFKN